MVEDIHFHRFHPNKTSVDGSFKFDERTNLPRTVTAPLREDRRFGGGCDRRPITTRFCYLPGGGAVGYSATAIGTRGCDRPYLPTTSPVLGVTLTSAPSRPLLSPIAASSSISCHSPSPVPCYPRRSPDYTNCCLLRISINLFAVQGELQRW